MKGLLRIPLGFQEFCHFHLSIEGNCIRIQELLHRIREGRVKEVVIATSTSVEGEATASYIADRLESHAINVTRIASGVPMGGDLQYVDPVTLQRAMDTRHAV